MVKTTDADSMLPFLLQAHAKEPWQQLDAVPRKPLPLPQHEMPPVKAACAMRFAEAMQIIQKNALVSVLLELRFLEYDRDELETR